MTTENLTGRKQERFVIEIVRVDKSDVAEGVTDEIEVPDVHSTSEALAYIKNNGIEGPFRVLVVKAEGKAEVEKKTKITLK